MKFLRLLVAFQSLKSLGSATCGHGKPRSPSIDPAQMLRRYADRLDNVHFKDIAPDKFAQVMKSKIRFFDTCAVGVMCPIRTGSIDCPAVCAALNAVGYRANITVEQERDSSNRRSILNDLAESRAFLDGVGSRLTSITGFCLAGPLVANVCWRPSDVLPAN